MAGQIVMEGFLDLRLRPWVRRLLTRLLAIGPAVAVAAMYGEQGVESLLIFSQVILSMQLPFAVIPLMLFAGDRSRLGGLVAPRWQLVLGWASAALILALNVKLLADVALGG